MIKYGHSLETLVKYGHTQRTRFKYTGEYFIVAVIIAKH